MGVLLKGRGQVGQGSRFPADETQSPAAGQGEKFGTFCLKPRPRPNGGQAHQNVPVRPTQPGSGPQESRHVLRIPGRVGHHHAGGIGAGHLTPPDQIQAHDARVRECSTDDAGHGDSPINKRDALPHRVPGRPREGRDKGRSAEQCDFTFCRSQLDATGAERLRRFGRKSPVVVERT